MLSIKQLCGLKAAFRRDVERAGGQEAATMIPGIRITRHQSFSEQGNVEHPERWPAIDVVVALALETGSSAVIAEMAKQVGGLFVPLPKGHGRGKLEISAGASAKEFGDVMMQIGAALSDAKISKDEASIIVMEIHEALVALVELSETVKSESEGLVQ